MTDPALPPALRTNPKYIFFTDFDGTITIQDSNDYMTDHIGFGADLRKKGNADVLSGVRSFRASFKEMMDSISLPFDQCIQYLLKHIDMDPAFPAFYAWCKAQNIPVVVISGGMEPVVRGLLGKFLGEDEVKDMLIVSNHVRARPGKRLDEERGWEIEFHDESDFGHDKSIEIRKYSTIADRPVLFYAGDGVSDLSAAKETDLLFAKAGKDLVTFCEREHVPFVTFTDFNDISTMVKEIVAGKVTVAESARGRIS